MEILEDQLERVAFGSLPAGLGALELECGQLRLLLEVSESIASHRDINALFQDLAQRLPRIVPFDLINLVLYDPARDLMCVHALVVPECHGALPAGLEFTLSETTSGLAWESQQPVKVEDVEAETRFGSLM